jgi:hypothetical protein
MSSGVHNARVLQARTFFVKPGSYGSPSPQSALGLADLRRQSQPDNLTVAMEVKSVSATFYDDFGGFVSAFLCDYLHNVEVESEGIFIL